MFPIWVVRGGGTLSVVRRFGTSTLIGHWRVWAHQVEVRRLADRRTCLASCRSPQSASSQPVSTGGVTITNAPGVSKGFADYIGRRNRLPYTTWGDFLRLSLRSGELKAVQSYADLLQLVAKYRTDNGVSQAKSVWHQYRIWLAANGHPYPDGNKTGKQPA